MMNFTHTDDVTLYSPRKVTELLGLTTSALNHYRSHEIGVRWTHFTKGGHYRYEKSAIMELALAKALSDFGLELKAISWFLEFVSDDIFTNVPLPGEWEHNDIYEPGEGQAYLIVRNRDLRTSIQEFNTQPCSDDETAAWMDLYSVERINNLDDIARVTQFGGTLIYSKYFLRKIPIKVYELPE